MKKLFLVGAILFFGKNFAQKNSTNEFKNVIEIECSKHLGVEKNYTCRDFYSYRKPIYKGNILLDLPLFLSEEKAVFSVLPELEIEKLKNIFPQIKNKIIITPNHALYRKKEGQKGEPPVSFMIYEIEEGKILKTRVLDNIQPDLFYQEMAENEEKNNGKIKVYFQENYGSICCPKDEIWKKTRSVGESAKIFEKKFGKKIHYFEQRQGREGEKVVFFTLEGLSKNEKLEFILHRKSVISPEKKDAEIFTPYWVEKK